MSATLPDWIFAIGVLGALLYYTYIIRQIGEKRYKDIALQLETLNWEIDKIRLKADIHGRGASTSSVANDPNRTKAAPFCCDARPDLL
jgi:hypothetical protein